jgi:hypothetical protein
MTLTIEKLPDSLNKALHQKAIAEGRTVQDVAVDAIARGLNVGNTNVSPKKGDWSEFIGSWVEDPEFDEAMKDFEKIDPELWK